MSKYLVRAVAARRKVNNGESLDEFDVAIIDTSLARTIRDQRTPFQRFRDHYIIGTERFTVLDGLDYYRIILMHRKSDVWYPDSDMSEISVFEVRTASQIEPPQDQNINSEDGTPNEYAFELLDRAHIGPSFSGTHQAELDPEAIESLRSYVAELSTINTQVAIERKEELEHFLREQTPGSKFIEQGNVTGVVSAYLKKYHYHGKPRAMRAPNQVVADIVRQSTTYARKVLRENPMTVDIAEHLEDNVRIGQVCEYTGDWKWRF